MGFEPTTTSLGGPLETTLFTIDQKALTLNWSEFHKWLDSKYAETYSKVLWCYCRKYHKLLDNNNVRKLDLLPDTIKSNVLKSLIVLSKYLGIHEEFKSKLKSHGIKTVKYNVIKSFLRILKASDSNILTWYKEASNIIRVHEQTYLKFLILSGLRKEEGINAFNKIIQLRNDDRLGEYYDNNLKCLLHFKYPETFLRNTKNVFITFITEDLLNEISNNDPVTYPMIIKRMYRKNIKCRLNELRDYYGTFLLHHGILEQEVNLLQGRIPPSIFIKHYWSPKLSELRDRIFNVLVDLEKKLS